ncbi:ATP-binding protein [Cyclobacterium sp.]|uniref:AAA family ATPase n=1 Tax=Cyclobacterium sp. TaxID=1966343 RepID=UPI00199737D7|nr:ATP-binding protein [Cyclobacterium sp.]MBD3630317.1 ATP-binding protein [Cyclobacterium sp.]
MNIKFTGTYKSITDFEWTDVPMFSVITGPNGTGKTQLLELLYNTVINKRGTTERVQIENETLREDEITFLKGEWQLNNTGDINLSSIQQQIGNHYNKFVKNQVNRDNEQQVKLFYAFQEIQRKSGKENRNDVSREEFIDLFPEILIEQEPQLSQKIAEVFYNYRLSEIELQAKQKSEVEIINEIGEKPWLVLKDILKESKLPFSFNNPSELGFRDSFQLKAINEISGDPVNFNDLSSGEKVLISLVFYLYNSQEKNVFPKILLMDEPDAHLHPTMSQQFINVVKNVLVDKFGVRVIMTTHSPSTVILTPDESLFEMSREHPRIKLSNSKNHTVSLLTSGLVYVGEGTKYMLVEDKDDANFYSYLFDSLTKDDSIDGSIPLVFIPASTSNKSGGKDVVQDWVNKLQDSGLEQIIQGVIDKDSGNETSDGVHLLGRYSIENYLVDPIIIYAALIDKEKHNEVIDVGLAVGEEYKLKSMSNEELQKVCDAIFKKTVPLLKKYFSDFNEVEEIVTQKIKFTNGIELDYPVWLINRRGKTLLHQVYNELFTSPVINFKTLFKALKKVNFIPEDIIYLLENLRS